MLAYQVYKMSIKSRNRSRVSAKRFMQHMQNFLNNPDSKLNKSLVVNASIELFTDAVKAVGKEPDKYMEHMINAMYDSNVRIHTQLNSFNVLDNLSRQVDNSDVDSIAQSAHALRLFRYEYLPKGPTDKKNHNIARIHECLQSIKQDIADFDLGSQADYKEHFEILHSELTRLTNEQFSLPLEEQKKKYLEYRNNVSELCHEHRDLIKSCVKIETVLHNLLYAISGLVVFYGLYLMATSKSRGSFFLQPDALVDETADSLADLVVIAEAIPEIEEDKLPETPKPYPT